MGIFGTYKVRGLSIPVEPMTTGNVFFVDSNNGNDANSGDRPNQAFATWDYANNQCTANQGDTIYLMPNHSEALTSAAITMDVAGVSVIGLGHGGNQPQLDFTGTAGKVIVSAADCSIKNVNFHANVSAVVIGLDIQAGGDYCVVEDCLFDVETTGTDEFLISINKGVTTGGIIRNNEIDMGLGGAAVGVKLVGASTGVKIQDNTIVGDYSTANINGITTLSTGVYIERNLLVNGLPNALGTVACIVLLTNSLSVIRDNTMFADVATHLLICTADTCLYSNNLCSDDSGTGSTTATTSATIVASADG